MRKPYLKQPCSPLPTSINNNLDTVLDNKELVSMLTNRLTFELKSEKQPSKCKDKWVVIEKRNNRVGESIMAVSTHNTHIEAVEKAKSIFKEMNIKIKSIGGKFIGLEKEGEFSVATYAFTDTPCDMLRISIMVAKSFQEK